MEKNNKDALEKTQIYNIKAKIADKNSLLKGFNLTKENIPFALIIISGLGGIIQLIEISKIDIAYIRFFSVSQLAADGTLVAFTLLTSYIMYRFYLSTLTAFDIIPNLKKAILNKDITYLKKVTNDIPPVLGFLLAVMGVAIFMHSEPFKVNLLLMIALSSMMIAGLAFVLKFFTLHDEYIKAIDCSPRKSWPNIILIATPAILIMYSIWNLSNIYLGLYKIPTPETLTNYSYVESRITQDYGKDKEYRIRYFNDKYMFIEITEEGSIAIYKTDDILFNAQHIIIEGQDHE